MRLQALRDYDHKSTIEDIRERFDNDVERFSELDKGQEATIDAPLVMGLIADGVEKTIGEREANLLDVGCGAGNFTLKLLQRCPNLNCTLNDLSLPMLERAKERVQLAAQGDVHTLQCDMRELSLEAEQFDVIVAAAVFHHLRDDEDWRFVFQKMFDALRPGGTMWISDLVRHDDALVHELACERYRKHLQSIGGKDYPEKVFAYIEKEDSPQTVTFQLKVLEAVGFENIEVLHKNACFAALYAKKGSN